MHRLHRTKLFGILRTVALFLTTCAGIAQADEESHGSVEHRSTFAKHPLQGGSPDGSYFLTAHAEAGGNGELNPPDGQTNPKYVKGGGADSAEAKATGKVFKAESKSSITYGIDAQTKKGFWDSSDSFASVRVIDTTKQVKEDAFALAFVSDPASYTVTYDPAFAPEIVFSIDFGAGMFLSTSPDGVSVSGGASFSGEDVTSLLSSPLWNFSWSSQLGDPNAPFVFHSNSALLLNDAAIMADFNSKVTTNNGVHTLGSNVHIEASIPVAPTLDNTIMYEFGGSTRFEAFASSVPEPCGGAIFATLALLLPSRWFGRHNSRS
jgi:hypothetical protein